MQIHYLIILSNRKTADIQIKNGQVTVRAPQNTSDERIREFVERHRAWIEKHLIESQKRQAFLNAQPVQRLTPEEIKALANQAFKLIPERTRYYAEKIGVTYGKISIRNQRSRWGSCSSKGNLSFNCLLMLAPLEIIDSVVVHELCHRKVPNHSKLFYATVLEAYPDYWKCAKWLKEHGRELMRRMVDETE